MLSAARGGWAIVPLAAAAVTLPACPARAADEPLLLEVEINGFPTGKVGEFILRGGVLMARPSELRDLGMLAPVTAADEPIAVLRRGLTVKVDAAAQVLHLTAPNSALVTATIRLDDTADGSKIVTSSTGATVDYDLNATGDGRTNVVSGLFDARVFAPWGVVSSGLLASSGAQPGSGGGVTLVRLDTTYTFSDTRSQRRYRAGDVITGSLAWTRSVRLGGVQVVADFSMRPDLITFPLPSVRGSAAVPSTVDVLVNGTRVYSGAVGVGPFEIPRLPVITGAGTISLAVTDALGRQVVTTLPFYATATLLAPGLQTYSAQAGFVRRSYGLFSNDYHQFAASGTYRRGLSQRLTVEASAEATRGTALVGVGGVYDLSSFAQINGALAMTRGSGGTGLLMSAGVQRTTPRFNLGASVTVASAGYRDIAAASGDGVARRQINANAGMALGRFGTVGVAYSGLDRDAATVPIRGLAPALYGPGTPTPGVATADFFVPAQHAHIVTASYSAQVRRFALYATAFANLARGGGNGFVVGLTMPLGGRRTVGVTGGAGSGGRYGQIQASQSIAGVGDWGFQALASAGPVSHQFAEVQHKAAWGLVTGGVDRINRETNLRVGAQGSLSYLAGGLFASNTITDSFAVVDTNGLAGVHVLQENRAAGRTNSTGRALVPELRAFDVNRLAIDPADIPLDSSIDVTTATVRPADRSGVIVRFNVKASHGALVKLVDATGEPIPLGSTATLAATGVVLPVGYDGAAFVEGLGSDNVVTVERPDGRRCTVGFAFVPLAGEIPTIGPLTCLEKTP